MEAEKVAGANDATDFETFWKIYPRRVAKKDAMKAWLQMDHNYRRIAVAALANHVKFWKSRGTELQHIPYPASWLRGERWTDELEIPPEMPQCDWNTNGFRDVNAGRCTEQSVKEQDGQFYCAAHCQRLGLRVVRG